MDTAIAVMSPDRMHMSSPKSGKLIVFEGIEGAGKTTQIQQVYQWLTSATSAIACDVIVTREPGDTPLGMQLRQVLLGEIRIDATAELLLYAADRAQHIQELIQPALAAGKMVLCDRFTYSTIAYQGYGRQLSLEAIDQLNEIATQGLQSDLTLWLDVEVETGLERIRDRGKADRIERADIEFHRRVQRGFEVLSRTNGNRTIRIDANLPEDRVREQIRVALGSALKQWAIWQSSDTR